MTEFAERVSAVVRSIPAGHVLTYGEVARRAGSPRAARAVGQLMKRNQRSYLVDQTTSAIPCHRVVAAGHVLGGFNAGSAAKSQLLSKEGWRIVADRLERA